MVGRAAEKRSMSFAIQRARSIPMERMLRHTWPADSSKEKNTQRSPRAQAAFTNWAAMVVLPVPAVPETRTVLPR